MFKVLIVDDEELICELIQNTIDWDKIGAKCIGTAFDGNSAYKKIKELQPNLIITDILIPGMDGISLIKKVRETDSKCGFIIVSGYQDFDYVKRAMELGADNYILKPIDQNELEKTITNSMKKYLTLESSDKKIEELEHEVSSIKKENRKNFLRKIISDNEITFDTISECNEEYGTNYRNGYFCTGIINIDYSNNINEKIIRNNLGLVESQFEKFLKEQLESIIFEADILQTKNNIVFMLNYEKKTEDELLKSLANMIRKIRSEQHAISFDITISLSNPTTCLSQIKSAYLQAVEASDYRIKVGVDRVIRYSDYNFAKYNIYKLLSIEWEHQFNCNIDIGNIDAIVDGIRELFNVLFQMEDVNPKAYYDLSEAILTSFKNKMRVLYLGIFDEEAYSELTADDSIRYHRKEKIVENLLSIIKETLTKCTNEKNLKDKKPINFAKQYVAEHYMEKILITDITQKIYLNDDYFSLMFKKETGICFSDYVVNYRMTVARQLLRSSDYSIAEVGEKVGYNDVKYFSRIFKKNVGISPGNYSKLYDKKDS